MNQGRVQEQGNAWGNFQEKAWERVRSIPTEQTAAWPAGPWRGEERGRDVPELQKRPGSHLATERVRRPSFGMMPKTQITWERDLKTGLENTAPNPSLLLVRYFPTPKTINMLKTSWKPATFWWIDCNSVEEHVYCYSSSPPTFSACFCKEQFCTGKRGDRMMKCSLSTSCCWDADCKSEDYWINFQESVSQRV